MDNSSESEAESSDNDEADEELKTRSWEIPVYLKVMNSDTAPFIPQDYDDAEKGSITNDFAYNNNVASSHIYIRNGFLRKVYGLLSIQLLLTAIVSGVFAYTPPIVDAMHSNPWILFLCLPVTFGLLFALHIKRRVVPTNFFLLGGFTVCISITVGAVVSLYQVQSVVKVLFLTLLITLSLTAFTFQTKFDFSKLAGPLIVCLTVLMFAGFINVLVGSTQSEFILAIFGTLIFSLCIIFDTYMMMHKLSPEEYILATINLYLDIINLFLELLRIFGERN